MSKMVVLRGLPGSGKSTRARELVAQGFKRVNKDDLRSMIDNGVWSEDNEDVIYLAQMALVALFLEERVPIVVDNTHGGEKQVRRLRALASANSYDFEIEVFSPSIDECIARDRGRTSPVGESVIRFMALQPFFRELYNK